MSLLVATSDTGLQDFGRQILEEHFSDYGPVLLASDSNSAIQLALTQQPDLILLTVGLPASGLHVARTIWNERAETKIIFWALIAEEASIREVMHILPPNAVYGYLLRTIGKEDLINSIRSVLVGNQHRLLDYNVLMDEIEQLNQWLEEHKEATNSQ